MNTTIKPSKRSIKLRPSERKALTSFYKSFNTEVDCAVAIGIDRNVLFRVRSIGSGSESTITKIRAKLNRETNLV